MDFDFLKDLNENEAPQQERKSENRSSAEHGEKRIEEQTKLQPVSDLISPS